jgi:hypothetical protein
VAFALSMWSLTSQRVRRTSGPGNFQSSAKKDFFNTIGTKRTWRDVCYESGMRMPAQPVDATQALNLSAGVSNSKVLGGRSFS